MSLRAAVGKDNLTLELPEESTISEVVSFFAENYGHLISKNLTSKNDVINYLKNCVILINGKDHKSLNEQDTKLHNGDVISILPPAGGG
ncbi:MAG: MoaD/ThiS family protein [Deltaproteobacteria bacterium]|nr:MoaD/ThiS family protein [Deltaproteobacteria bacterium]